MNAKLTVRQESGRVTEFPVTKDEIKIGRTSARNDLVLDDLSVSREHAVISRNGDVFTVTDLRSANGTFVNGVMLEGSVVWNAGDEVVIGKTTLLLETEKPAPPPAPAKKAVDDIRFGEIHDVDGTIMVSLVPEQLFSALKPITASHSAVQREREREKERESGIFKAKPPIAAAAPEAFDETATKKPGPMEPEEELRRLRKKEEILSLLYELGNVLSSSFTLDEIYKKASEMLFRVTPADHCVILLGENVESLTPVSTAKSPSLLEREQGSSRQNIVVSRTITARVMNERIALLLYDAQKEFTGSESIMLQAIHSVMCAPLTGKEGLLGAIYVDRRDLLSRFEEVDLELLLAIAAQTAVAIENTKARDQLQKEAVVRERLGRFLPAGVVDRVMKGEIKLGGVSQDVTTLFA
ncbi:MAG: FHA domain-containing protein, partial [Acidobacteria bacterium]|nr:FHA domain-containing protein [Acidobacteriota bacterium]